MIIGNLSRFIYGFISSLALVFLLSQCKDLPNTPSDPIDSTECCGQFILVVKDSSEHPVVGATAVVKYSGAVIGMKETDSTGRAIFDSLCPGTYQFSAYYQNNTGWRASGEFTISSDSCDVVEKIVYLSSETDSCCNSTLTVIVQDDSGNRIPYTYLRLFSGRTIVHEGYTNENGTIQWNLLCAGQYVLSALYITVDESGDSIEVWKEKIVVIDCNEHKEILLTFEDHRDCCNNRLEIITRDQNNERLPGILVYLYSENHVVRHGYTNSQGIIVWEGLCEGTYIIKGFYYAADSTGDSVLVETVVADVRFECGQNKEVILGFNHTNGECCNNRLVIVAKDQRNHPLPGVWVRVYANNQVVREGYTNHNGVIVFEELCAGEYAIVAGYFSYSEERGDSVVTWKDRSVHFSCNQTKEIVFEYEIESNECCENVLKVLLRDSSHHPIEDAEVRFRYRNGETIEVAYTNDDGVVLFDGICQGNYEVRIAHPDFPVQEVPLEFGCDAKRLELLVVFTESETKVVVREAK